MTLFKCSEETLKVLSKVQQGKILGLIETLKDPENLTYERAINITRWYVGIVMREHDDIQYIQKECGVTVEVLKPFFDKIEKSFEDCCKEILQYRQNQNHNQNQSNGNNNYRDRGYQRNYQRNYRQRPQRQYKQRDVGEELYKMETPMDITISNGCVRLMTKPIKLPVDKNGENIKFGLPKIKEEFRSSPEALEYGFVFTIKLFRLIFKIRGHIEEGKKVVEITWYKSGEDRVYCRATKFKEYIEDIVEEEVVNSTKQQMVNEDVVNSTLPTTPPNAPIKKKAKKSFADVLRSNPSSESVVTSLISKFNKVIDETSFDDTQLSSLKEIYQKLTVLIPNAPNSA